MKKCPLALGLWLATAALFAQTPTLEQLLSAPNLSQLTLSGPAEKIAWVENRAGKINIVTAQGPDYQAKPLTNFTADDGIELSNLHWLPDENGLVFVRGNAPQVRARANHNPAHLLEGAVPTIWKISYPGGQMEKIGPGGGLAVSGKRLAFVREGQIYLKNLDDTTKAQQLCFVRGGAGQLRWSPDGQCLAFVSGRGAYSYVGVYEFAKHDYRFLEPGIDQDMEPEWSPDGRQLAFLRLRHDPAPEVIFFPNRTSEPWSILVAELATDKTRTVFTADPGTGSVYSPHTGDRQLAWTATNQLVFAWEKTGWRQLYAVPAAGGQAKALTVGAFEVDEVGLAADRKHLLYTTNQNDLDRKDVFVVTPLEGEPRQLIPDPAGEDNGVEFDLCPAPSGNPCFFLKSTARTPARVALARGKTVQFLTQMPPDFKSEQLVAPEALTLTAKDGQKFQCQVFYPKQLRRDHTHPAVIFVHGGSRRQMYTAYHSSRYYANAYHLSQYFAAQGYVAMSINYRSGIGYGEAFREAEHYGASGNSEFMDLEAAGEWLRAQAAVSPTKIGVWGGSYGGYMTAMALARRSDLFAAGGDIHGVWNWNTEIPTFMPEYDSLHFERHAQLAYQSSPIRYLDGWRSPVLFIHGDDDQNVPFNETVQNLRALRRRGVEAELLVLPDEVHGFLRHESWVKAYKALAEFMERRLR